MNPFLVWDVKPYSNPNKKLTDGKEWWRDSQKYTVINGHLFTIYDLVRECIGHGYNPQKYVFESWLFDFLGEFLEGKLD